jgi:hypothetical protein
VVKHQRLVHLFVLSALLVLSGCSLQPSDAASGSGDQSGSDQSAASDLEAIVCQCPNDSPSDDFMLGLQALSQGDYAAAGQHFEEHALSGGEQAPAEAAIGQALADTLSEYPIGEDSSTADEVTDRAMLIDLVLVLIAGLEQKVAELSAENATLAVDLEKREEALKRLRELTLGQPEA